MRVKLTVNRQGLPPVKVLWDADTLRPVHVGGGVSNTVAQLLESINEIIPLEAEYWGLEDYLVEVNGFECLHFCSLNILKEDDLVTVRPLQTSDIRHRRVSGRHQITADGRHLIDGVAFGRPFLKRSERPPIRIPPRKRVRLTYDTEDDNESASLAYNTEQALVPILNDSEEEDDGDYTADHNSQVSDNDSDADKDDPGGDVDAIDYEGNKAFRDELAMEAEYLSRSGQDPVHSSLVNEKPGRRTRSHRKSGGDGLGLHGEGVLLEPDGEVLIGGYHNPLLDQYYDEEPVQAKTKTRKRKRTREVDVQTSDSNSRKSRALVEISRRSSTASTKSVRFLGDEIETPATILEVDGSDSEGDEDFEPESRDSSNSLASNKENIEPLNVIGESTESSTELQLDLSDSSDVESNSSYTSSSLSSSSDESSSHRSSQTPVKNILNDPPTPKPVKDAAKDAPSRSNALEIPPALTPPGNGLNKTKKRNERRKLHNRLLHLKKIRVLDANATLDDYHNYMKDRAPDSSLSQEEEQAAFEEKRKQLLESIAAGGIDQDQDLGVQQEPDKNLDKLEDSRPTNVSSQAVSIDLNGIQPTNAATSAPSYPQDSVSLQVSSQMESNLEFSSSQPFERRSKLDLASSRRLLFGSLGLRTPKTKADEQKLREKMMENAKPVRQRRSAEDNVSPEELADVNSVEDDRWKDGIILGAVECCYEGVELSTPPFPFVQRWDPQQQGGFYDREYASNKSKRNKRKKKGNSSHQDEGDMNGYWVQDQYEPEENEEEGLQAPNSGSDDLQRAVDNQLLQDATAVTAKPAPSMDDLPDIPAEVVSYCDALILETAVPGAVISFKQLEMSQETNWQPKISDYRTAKITSVSSDGTLELLLAQRDRPSNKHMYDEETGDRVYSKFEMPDYEDEDAEDIDGVIEIGFADLIEPKVIVGGKPQVTMPEDSSKDLQESSYVDAPDASKMDASEGQRVAPDNSYIDMSAIETIDMSEIASVISEEDEEYEPKEADLSLTQSNLEVKSEIMNVTYQEDDEYEPDEVDVSFAKSNLVPETAATGVAEDLSVRTREEMVVNQPTELNEETRQEISQIIKEAGFRSTVDSDLGKGLEQLASKAVPLATQTKESSPPSQVMSPKFNGFTSSPPAEQSSRYADTYMDGTVQSQSYNRNSTNIVNMESSEPNEQTGTGEDLPPLSDPMEDSWRPDQLDDDSLPYPALPNYTSENRRRDDSDAEKDMELPTSSYSRSKQSTRKSTRASKLFMSTQETHSSDFADAQNASSDELPSLTDVFSTARSKLSNTGPEWGADNENHRALRKRSTNSRNDSLDRGSTPANGIKVVVPSSAAVSRATNSNHQSEEEDEGTLPIKSSYYQLPCARKSSAGDSRLISAARYRDTTSNHDSDDEIEGSLTVKSSMLRATRKPPSSRKKMPGHSPATMSKGFSVSDIFAPSSPRAGSDGANDALPEVASQPSLPLPKRTSRQASRQVSQPPPGSQVVDLTLSSDPVGPEEDLPNGPGWVRKSVLRTKKVLGKRRVSGI